MSKLTLSVLFASLFAAHACKAPGTYSPPPAGAMEESQWKDRVNVTFALQAQLAVRGVRESHKNGLLRVQIDITNLLQAEASYRSSIEWFDISGFRLDSPNDGWKSGIAQPLEEFTLNASAVSPEAVSWRLNMDTWDR